MKQQIRRNVFETNSSTQHTLTLIKSKTIDSTWEKFKKENPSIVVGLTLLEKVYNLSDPFVVEMGKLSLQEKIDLLFYSTMCSYDTMSFVKNIGHLMKFFKEEGIQVRVMFDNIMDQCDEYGWIFETESMPRFINDNNTSKDEIKQFIVSNECWYTSYADDCMDEPKEITNLFEQLKNIPEEDVLFAHDRN